MAEAAVRDDQRHGGGGGGGIDVVVVEEDSVATAGRRPSRNDNDDGGGGNNGSRWEIEEVEPAGAPSAPAAGAGIVPPGDAAEDVYVAVGKGGSSMAALSWALRRLTKPRSFVYLVHVFPVVTSIPTPLRMMRKGQATPEQVETYMNQERSKRREMLQKFLDHCRNFQVIVDVYLIESDQIVDAIIELIPVLTIKQLVLGVSKSNVRMLKKGSTIAEQVQKSAPLYCDVKIICDGKEVPAVTSADPTPPFSPSPVNYNSKSHTPTPPFSPSPINYNSRSHTQTPPSSTPYRDDVAANDDKDNTNPKERKKIPKFFRCLSFS